MIPSLKLTWHLKIAPWKRRFLLETIIFRSYVSFRECSSLQLKICIWKTELQGGVCVSYSWNKFRTKTCRVFFQDNNKITRATWEANSQAFKRRNKNNNLRFQEVTFPCGSHNGRKSWSLKIHQNPPKNIHQPGKKTWQKKKMFFFSNPSDPNFAVGVGEARKKHVPYFPWNPACLIWILIMLYYSR